jgi:hypothetical protein
MSKDMRARNWFFTLNNPTAEDKVRLDAVECAFRCYQLEKSASGTPHYQGVLIFKEQVTRTKLRRLFRSSWEAPCKHTMFAIDYCSKRATRIDGPWISGEIPFRKFQAKAVGRSEFPK